MPRNYKVHNEPYWCRDLIGMGYFSGKNASDKDPTAVTSVLYCRDC